MLAIGVIGSGARARAVGRRLRRARGWRGEVATARALVVAGDTTAETLALLPEALRAGKPTLCLALPGDSATLDGPIALADRHGATLSLPNALRYHPATIALRETLLGGEAGPLLSARSCPGAPVRRRAIRWRRSAPPGLDLLGWLLPAQSYAPR